MKLDDFPDGVDSCCVVQKWLHLAEHSHDMKLVEVENIDKSQGVRVKLDLEVLKSISEIVYYL